MCRSVRRFHPSPDQVSQHLLQVLEMLPLRTCPSLMHLLPNQHLHKARYYYYYWVKVLNKMSFILTHNHKFRWLVLGEVSINTKNSATQILCMSDEVMLRVKKQKRAMTVLLTFEHCVWHPQMQKWEQLLWKMFYLSHVIFLTGFNLALDK